MRKQPAVERKLVCTSNLPCACRSVHYSSEPEDAESDPEELITVFLFVADCLRFTVLAGLGLLEAFRFAFDSLESFLLFLTSSSDSSAFFSSADPSS